MTTEPPIAEAPQLKPLGVGDIVDRVFALYRSRPLLLLALSTIPYLAFFLVVTGIALAFASTLLRLGTPLSTLALDPSRADAVFELFGGVLATLFLIVAVVVLVAFVIFAVQSAALIAAIGALYLRRPITASGVFREGLSAAPRIIGASILVFLLVMVLWIALVIAMIVVNQGIATALAILFGIVATVYIFASTLVAPVVATLEKAGPLTAIRRSFRLSAGNRWRIIGVQFLLLILNAVIGGLLSAIFLGGFINDPTTRTVVQQVANLLTNVAWAPVQWGTFAVLYYDLRVRHEAFDLQLAAESLPRQS